MEGTYFLRTLQQITKGGLIIIITCCNKSTVLFENVATDNEGGINYY